MSINMGSNHEWNQINYVQISGFCVSGVQGLSVVSPQDLVSAELQIYQESAKCKTYLSYM